MNPSELTCPKCGRPEQIQKVTSVYGDNTKEWTERSGGKHSHTVHRQARTLLGEKLAPPVKPSGPTHPMLWYGIGGFVLFILLSTICPIFITVPLAFVVPLGAMLVGTETNIPVWIPITGVACFGLFSLVAIAVVVWVALKIKQRFDQAMANYNSQKAKVEAEELPRWQRATDRWNQLYYCARDETVFIPGENKAIPADNMKDYLFDPYFQPH
jgi:hypothetical protein